MVGIAEQRLKRFQERRFLTAEGFDVLGQVEIPAQQQHRLRRHAHLAFEPGRRVEGHTGFKAKGPLRHQHAAPRRGGIGGFESRGIVSHAIAYSAVIPHVDLCEHVAQKDGCDIFDHQIVDPDDAPGLPGQIDPEMPVLRLHAPDHVHPGPVPGAYDGGDLLYLAIGRQLRCRPELDQPARPRSVGQRGIARDAHGRKIAADRLDPRRYPQVAARQNRSFPLIAQSLYRLRLQQFERAAEILIRRNECRIRRTFVTVRTGRSIAAGIGLQPIREGARHQQQSIGNRLVH